MKKRTYPLAVILAAILTATALPLVAYAVTGNSTQEMDVSFTLTEEDITPPTSGNDGSGSNTGDDEPSGSYIIQIPSNISLNHEQDFFVNATTYGMPNNSRIVVSVDGAQTFPDGTFFLTCGDGASSAQRMACNIQRGYAEDMSIPMETLAGPDDAVVAVIDSNGRRTSFGWIKLEPLYRVDNIPGVYTGTVRFKITMERD